MPGAIRKDKYTSDGDEVGSRLLAQARQFLRLCFQWEKSVHRSPVLRSITLYPPKTSRYGGWLVVAKVWSDGEKLVGFHRSPDPLTAVLGALTKLSQGSLDLKPDTYTERHYGG